MAYAKAKVALAHVAKRSDGVGKQRRLICRRWAHMCTHAQGHGFVDAWGCNHIWGLCLSVLLQIPVCPAAFGMALRWAMTDGLNRQRPEPCDTTWKAFSTRSACGRSIGD